MQYLPTIAGLAKKYNIKPLKKYGQNFIFDLSLCEKIVRASKIPQKAHVLEIGPGTAGLTRAILNLKPANLTVIEADRRFIPLLQEIGQNQPNLQIIEGDALKFDVAKLKIKNLHIIANLPYNIGTKLLINWLKQIDHIASITIMLQKEVVERIRGAASTKEYGRLSVICSLICDIEKCFDVARGAFYPPPKVESTVVRLTPKINRPNNEIIEIVEKITQKAFSQRRKTLRSSIKGLNLEQRMQQLNLSPQVRAENLGPEDYLALAVKL